ncbi:MAG: hydrogenase iron-sulfur subunit [Candidatus Lokiarchaeota archaeon]|nr:hydrogenase iron-sulfur subunit [Candidatus Lokiarchaeota archaeon]
MKREINIIAFVCNECTYAAADLAGISRFKYPSNIKLIRLPCTGKVDLLYILESFANGADGVIVSGCLKDQCHYEMGNKSGGNYNAEKIVEFAKNILDEIGIEKERLEMHFISSSMATKWIEVANNFTEKIRKLGKLKKN